MAFVTQQEYLKRTVRAAAILTSSYVAGTVIGADSINGTTQEVTSDNVDQFNFLALEVDFTLGSLTTAGIIVEFSEDNSTWFQVQKSTTSGGVTTFLPYVIQLSATGKYYININSECFNGGGFHSRYFRISAIGVGTATSSSMTITAITGVV